MYLGIEIGGTKLQLGIGVGQQPQLIEIQRRTVDVAQAAGGIRDQILEVGRQMTLKHYVSRIGVGFGGPVWGDRGVVQTSHQVSGWNDFPLAAWLEEELGIPAVIGNDCDVAALAEARYGAGQGAGSVFYITVGTGIGGGFVLNGTSYGASRPAVAEIGHLRPGLNSLSSAETIESFAAGPGIAANFRKQWANLSTAEQESVEQTLATIGTTSPQVRSEQLAVIAQSRTLAGELAQQAWLQATQTLGWGIAQMITLLAPEVVVIGGGVSLAGDTLFWNPLRESVDQYSFPALKNSCKILPAALKEEVVIHGAIALAAQNCSSS